MMMMRKLIAALTAVVMLGSAAFVSAAAAPVALSAKGKANIYVVARKSFCVSTGISDYYTGNGKVEFFLTLRNSGPVAGSVSIVPVRYYDDGGMNASVMDMVSANVPARATRKFHTPRYTYKAHEHEVDACAVRISGRSDVPIQAISLGGT
jgi:hypothetical protein